MSEENGKEKRLCEGFHKTSNSTNTPPPPPPAQTPKK